MAENKANGVSYNNLKDDAMSKLCRQVVSIESKWQKKFSYCVSKTGKCIVLCCSLKKNPSHCIFEALVNLNGLLSRV